MQSYWKGIDWLVGMVSSDNNWFGFMFIQETQDDWLHGFGLLGPSSGVEQFWKQCLQVKVDKELVQVFAGVCSILVWKIGGGQMEECEFIFW